MSVALEVRLFVGDRASTATLHVGAGESAEAAVQRFMQEHGLHTKRDASDMATKLLSAVRSRMAARPVPEPTAQQRAGEIQVSSSAAAVPATSKTELDSEVADSDATVWVPISAPLAVRHGQRLEMAARAFCERHGLDPSTSAPALLAPLREAQRHLAGAPARAMLGAAPLVQAAAAPPGHAHGSESRQQWPSLPIIGSRSEFGALLEQLGFRTGIEIGVQRGRFAAHLLHTWPGCTAYYGIDPWEHQAEYADAANVQQAEHDSNYAATRAALAQFGPKVHLLRSYSVVRGDVLRSCCAPRDRCSPPPRAHRTPSRDSRISRSTLCTWMADATTSACSRTSRCTGPSCGQAASWPATTS